MSATVTSEELTQQHLSIREAFDQQQQHRWVTAKSTPGERIAKLKRLHRTILKYRNDIKTAMFSDLGKSSTEVDITEVGVINSEIRHCIRHLRSWMTPKRVGTPLALIGTRSEIQYRSKGVCLIISPWNFPFNLTFAPLVSAIAAGNCAILKPSELTPASSALMKKIVAECFAPEEVVLFEGDAQVAQELLSLPFNHIFFTGSPAIGKIIMAAAAKNLSSVTLELGGKSPVIVDETANLEEAASKIIWLKCMNAGQICISCDYVLVQESVHDKFVDLLSKQVKKLYGATSEDRQQSPDLCKIVNKHHHARLQRLLDEAVQMGATVRIGGHTDASRLFTDPTVLTGVPDAAKIWKEEIFGPLLPVRPFKTLDDAIQFVNDRSTPLAMYIFSRKQKNINKILQEAPAGGVAINDCGIHFYQTNLPFGGINNSGIGNCHGKAGFLEFSNQVGVTIQNRIFPHTRLFLPPYGRSKLVKLMLEGIAKWF